MRDIDIEVLQKKCKKLEDAKSVIGKGSDIQANMNQHLNPAKCYEILIIEMKDEK